MVKAAFLLTVCLLYKMHLAHAIKVDLKEACFTAECLALFPKDDPYCGSDGKPYPNLKTLVCADQCAKRYGGEVHGTDGLCPGLPNAIEYWKKFEESGFVIV